MIPLETQRLILRDFVESDWSEVHKYAADAEVVRYLTFGPNSEEDTKKFLQREISLQGEEPRQHFALAVTLKPQKQLIGICRISVQDTNNKIGSIGYSFTKEFWGQGYATEAVKAVITFGFQDVRLTSHLCHLSPRKHCLSTSYAKNRNATIRIFARTPLD